MKIWLIFVIFVTSFAIIGFSPSFATLEDDYGDGGGFTNFVHLLNQQVSIYRGIKCRSGYHKLSDEIIDASRHCMGLKFVKRSRKKFTSEKVQLTSTRTTPLLCMQACVFSQVGLVNEDLTGLNETAVFNTFKDTFSRSELSAFILTKELMNCDRKHPTLFPKHYRNCSAVREFFRCARKVLLDCSDKTTQYRESYFEYQMNKTYEDKFGGGNNEKGDNEEVDEDGTTQNPEPFGLAGFSDAIQNSS